MQPEGPACGCDVAVEQHCSGHAVWFGIVCVGKRLP